MEEEFKAIKSLSYLYEINSNGTIFRNVKTKKNLKIKLDLHHSKKGYYVTFVHFNGRKPNSFVKRVMIHRAVAEAWIGECPDGYEVDHKDRNSHNNDYHNLRYVTKSEQMKNRNHSNISKTGKTNLEIARKERMVSVELINKMSNEKIKFESISDCSKFLASQYGNSNFEKYRYYVRFKKEYKDYYINRGDSVA